MHFKILNFKDYKYTDKYCTIILLNLFYSDVYTFNIRTIMYIYIDIYSMLIILKNIYDNKLTKYLKNKIII
jgi:hypothetical protein